MMKTTAQGCLVSFAAGALAALSCLTCHTALADAPAWQALKTGGHVVLMRHAQPEQGPGKGNALVRDPSCAKERKLSQQGKADAARVGEAFRGRGIPVGEVLASPYCRTTETARIAFGQVAPADFLSLSEGLAPAAVARITAEAMRRIGEYRDAANLVMVSHEPNIAAITFELVEQGAFLVLKPLGGGEFDIVGKIQLHELSD